MQCCYGNLIIIDVVRLEPLSFCPLPKMRVNIYDNLINTLILQGIIAVSNTQTLSFVIKNRLSTPNRES